MVLDDLPGKLDELLVAQGVPYWTTDELGCQVTRARLVKDLMSGVEDAVQDAMHEAEEQGRSDGYDEGYADAKDEEYNKGHDQGFSEGYDKGYAEAEEYWKLEFEARGVEV